MLQYLKKITADPKLYIGLHNLGKKMSSPMKKLTNV